MSLIHSSFNEIENRMLKEQLMKLKVLEAVSKLVKKKINSQEITISELNDIASIVLENNIEPRGKYI